MIPGPEGQKLYARTRAGSADLTRRVEAEERYRLTTENAMIGICLVSPEGRFNLVNPALCRMLDRDAETLMATTWQELTHPDDVALDQDRVNEIAAGRISSFQMRKRYLKPDGSVVWGDLSVSCARNDDGSVRYFVSQIVDVTEQEYVERALAETSRKYQLLAENASDLVVLASPDRVITWVSPSVSRTLGFTTEDLMGARLVDLVHPDDAAATATAREQVYAGAEIATPPGGFLLRIRTRSGRYRWMSGVATPVTDESGVHVGVVSGLRDVDDLVQAREAAQADRAVLRATLDSLLDPHVRYEAVRDETGQIVDFRYVEANPAACAYLGKDYQDLVGARMLDLFPGVAGASLLDRYRHVVETGEPLILDDFVYDHERIGEERHFDLRAARVGDGVSNTWRDVTDRHTAALRLAESEERFRVTTEHALVGMCLASSRGRFILVNPALCQMLGRDAQTLMELRWQDLTHPADLAIDQGLTDDVVAGRIPAYQIRKRYLKPDGAIMWGDLSVSCVRNDDGSVRYLMGQIVDVSEQVQAEQALDRATAEFEAAFEYAQGGMALVGRDRRILKANQALSEITGYGVDQLKGMSLDDLTDRRDAPLEQDQFAEMMAGPGDEYRCELRLATADGSRRWVSYGVALIGEDKPGNHAVLHVEDITDRKGYEARLLYLAAHDPLTGLANRRQFREDLEQYLALATRAKVGGALILLDLDNFKDINDTLGHPTGDALLCAIADVFRRRFRQGDLIARVGGDEFAVLLWGLDLAQSTAFTRRVIDAVREVEIDYEGQPVRATVSAGLVMLDNVGAATADDLIANADLAMYEAKDNGRDQVVAYDSAGLAAERSRARFHWTDQLRRALDEDRFTLLAQPILGLATGQITGCELLLRMRLDGHLAQPEEFIGIAEQQGLAAAIDTRVIQLGTDLAARYRQRSGFRWEINLSGASLGDSDLPSVIARELALKKLAPESFVFEITESAAITNFTKAITFANRVSDIGCAFALDDFGAGYGSFYYLKHLPCDYLKIDGEFVRDLRTNRTNRVIVQALVSASRSLGKQTIAEYVADEPTLDLLRQYGVDHAQGVYVGLPTPPSTGFLVSQSA